MPQGNLEEHKSNTVANNISNLSIRDVKALRHSRKYYAQQIALDSS